MIHNVFITTQEKLEQKQYSAALVVTGAWRGTNRQRLYEELGWESLYHRRWYRSGITSHFIFHSFSF